ncbi:hypothetical protein [Halobiforma nitratireducens]|uniref:Uncharacterized protein n=1 Tax=Halobiforma nitratireducens JCM 10879 TaxID=1227454 RepID=M0LYM2_9EURY|nr:hypothetical protein [Halobiforma nitratireducens]EMA38516.1 hypothetical protein C446_09885 [Halobiforma nitratireducens JCM 10879]
MATPRIEVLPSDRPSVGTYVLYTFLGCGAVTGVTLALPVAIRNPPLWLGLVSLLLAALGNLLVIFLAIESYVESWFAVAHVVED